MQTHRSKRRVICLLGALALALCLMSGCGAQNSGAVTSLAQLGEPGRKIGVPGDLPEFDMLKRDYPEAEVVAYDDYPLAYEAVRSGRLDAFFNNQRLMEAAIDNGTSGVRLLEETYHKNIAAVGISPVSKIPALQEQINEFLAELRADGTLDEMYDRWIIRGEDVMPDIPVPERSELRLRVGTTGIVMPFTYYVGTELSGFDIELARRFAARLGAELEFKIYDYGGIVPAAQSGDVDCIMANLYVTEERAESLPFSDPLYEQEIAAMVRDTDAPAAGAQTAAVPEMTEFSDLRGKTVSMITGAPFEELVLSRAPDVGGFSYFTSTPDMLLSLKAGKTDAALINKATASLAVNRTDGLTLFPKSVQDVMIGFAFAKGSAERDVWQAACDTISEETKQALWEKWTGADESVKTLPEQDWPGMGGTVRVAACDTLEPMCYAGKDGELKGFDIEMILLMAKELDVHVEFIGMEFSSVLSYVQSGKALLGAGAVIITEERRQTMDFVEYYPTAFVLVVRSASAPEAEQSVGVVGSVIESFEKTFIRENRWKLFVQGIGTTMLITVLAILFGTALGFGTFLLCRRGNPAANAATRFLVWLVQGMPVVVLLMILYYVIFGRVSISGTAVSVVGFALVFGAAVYAMVKSGVATVDVGQTEAAYALGYTDTRTFFRVVLPQALPHIMPAYKGEITALIKATAIVGYVAVQDLTKMGDIVRSRTYDAFFPLIAVAVIYFILAAILTAVVNRIELRIDPKRRRKEEILKGVKTDD